MRNTIPTIMMMILMNFIYSQECYSNTDCQASFACIPPMGDCEFATGPGECIEQQQDLCFNVEIPVCGCDGIIYSNECFANNWNGVGVAYEGECETENTECYTNSDCDGFPCISAFGDCNFENGPGTCDYMNYSLVDPHCYLYPEDPVCSCNGQTYLNECDALFGNGTGIAYVGECEQDPQPGDECELEDGEIGFYDCLTLNCHPVDQLEFLGDDNCQDGMWDFSLDCPEFGYDCGDCNADWDGTDPLGFCGEDYDGPVWHITPDGSDETGDGSVENPFATIQHGINTAVDGDTVLVAPGTYFENINFLGKNISIIGEDKETTIIDGNQIGSVVTFENGEDSTAVLNRFTIQNGIGGGRPFDFFGGGITCTQSNPILRNLIISNNDTYFGGSAIACFQGSPQLDNIIIQNNNHTGFGEAGTIYAVLNSNINIENVTITENEMTWGTGLFVWNSNVNLDKVTIYGNNADDHGGGIMIAENARLSIKNSILWNNTPQEIWIADEYLSNELDISYSNIQGGIDSIIINNNGTINWLEGNINTDPLFTDPENGDFTLQPNSPCIDAGDPNSPLDLDGTVADMGAFYFDQLSITNIPDKMIPQKLYLSDGFPNPFNPIVKFEFGVPLLNSGGFGMSDVLLNVYDIRGVLIKNLINENYKPGNYSVIWNAEDLPSGVYLIRLQIGNESKLTKVSLLK